MADRPARWRVYKHKSLWMVDRPSAAWGTRPNDGWAGAFETWDEAIQWATDPAHRLDWYDQRPRNPDPAHRLMWAEGLVL